MRRSIAAFAVLLAVSPLPADPNSLAFQEPPPEEVFGEEITVTIHPLVVRVVDNVGNPVLGLGPGDFAVRVGKAGVPVASVDWVDAGEPPLRRPPQSPVCRVWRRRRPRPHPRGAPSSSSSRRACTRAGSTANSSCGRRR